MGFIVGEREQKIYKNQRVQNFKSPKQKIKISQKSKYPDSDGQKNNKDEREREKGKAREWERGRDLT